MGKNNNRSKATLRNTQNNTRRRGGTLNYIEVKQGIERRQLKKQKGEADRRRDETACEGLAQSEGRGRSKSDKGGNGDEGYGKNAVTIKRGATMQYSNPVRGQDDEDISVPDGRTGKQGG